MSFSETIFLFFLALIIFGPKKLPEIARQAGRILAELRRASNEFRSQIETEIAHLEVEKNRPAPATGQTPQPAALSLNPASETVPRASESGATLASPNAVAGPSTEGSAAEKKAEPGPAPEPVAETGGTASQVSHV